MTLKRVTTFLDPSYVGFLDLPSQRSEENRAQSCGNILLPDDHAFEWPFLKKQADSSVSEGI